MSLCECGCGREVKLGNRFIHGHNGRGEAHSKRVIQWHLDHPKEKELARLKNIVTCSDLKWKRSQSDKLKQFFIDNLEARISAAIKQTGKKASDATKLKMSESAVKLWNSGGFRSRMIDVMSNSKAVKSSVDAMRGGHDIVDHHVSYDFLRLEALIVKVSRSFHGQIHHPKGCKFGTYGYLLID